MAKISAIPGLFDSLKENLKALQLKKLAPRLTLKENWFEKVGDFGLK